MNNFEQNTLIADLRRARSRIKHSFIIMISMVLLLGIAAPVLFNFYWIKALTSAMTLSIAVAGVALLYGQLGLISLCQFSLIGVGGWVALRTSYWLNLPVEFSVLTGGLLSCIVGMIVGLISIRTKGLYLALATLMLAGAFQVLISITGFPDGGHGFLGRSSGVDRSTMARPTLALSDDAYFTYVSIWLALVMSLIEAHRHSRAGRSWAFIRRGEEAALSVGVNVWLYQTWAFGLAGFCAGISGGLLAGAIGQLDGRMFLASESIMIFVLTVVGGAYHWLGIIISGLLLRAVPAMLTDIGINGYLSMIFFGATLLHSLVFSSSGVAGQLVVKGEALLSTLKSVIRVKNR